MSKGIFLFAHLENNWEIPLIMIIRCLGKITEYSCMKFSAGYDSLTFTQNCEKLMLPFPKKKTVVHSLQCILKTHTGISSYTLTSLYLQHFERKSVQISTDAVMIMRM